MKRGFLVFILLSLVLGTLAAAYIPQQVIPLNDDIYADMDDLYLLEGIGTPSNSRPWTMNEANAILSVVEVKDLKGAAKKLYDALSKALGKDLRWTFPDEFSLGADLDVALEFYAHTNTDLADGFTSHEDWIYGFVDRKPLLKLQLDMAVSDFFYTYCDLQYGYGLFSYGDVLATLSDSSAPDLVGALIPDTSQVDLEYVDGSSVLAQYSNAFSNNLLSASRDFDFQWPKRAVLSLGGEKWNFSVSRDKLSWGNSSIGNFIIDDHVDFHEYARLSIYTEYFKYEAVGVFFDTYYASNDFFRMLMAHRLEFRPVHKVTFAVSENVMYQNDQFDLRFLNPAFIYHNLNERDMFNAIAHVELDYTPVPGIHLYTQFALDQAVAPNENPDTEDTAWGLLAGFEYALDLNEGVFSTALEGSLALPSMYRRDKVDFLMARRYAGLMYWGAQKFDYIGSPYGGDVVVVKWDTRYRKIDSAEFAFSLTSVWKGGVDMYTPISSGETYTDYGTKLFTEDLITFSLIGSLGCSVDLTHVFNELVSCSLYGQLDGILIMDYLQSTEAFDNQRSDLQLSVGMAVSL